jgi:hypothetical protein
MSEDTGKPHEGDSPITIGDIATVLLAVQREFFGRENLARLTDLCRIQFRSEIELANALTEWHLFGLYVIVSGIQNNFSQTHNVGVGVAIAREFLDQFVRLPQSGVRRSDIDHRIKLYESVETTQGCERVQFAVAGLVLGQSAKPGMIPKGMEAYEFSIAANRIYIGVLKAVNDVFSEHRV